MHSAAPALVVSGLDDLSTRTAITADARAIAGSGDLAAAETRITDLETLRDDNAAALRQAAPGAWATVDGADDAAFSALRAGTPGSGAARRRARRHLCHPSGPARWRDTAGGRH